jgi:PAS domain S-box-containing protein
MGAGIRPKRSKTALRQATEPAGLPYHLLEELREVLDRILEMSSDGIFVVRNGLVKKCNHFLATNAGYAIYEIEGTCFASFFDRESIPAVEALCGRTKPGRGTLSLDKAVLVCKNGKTLGVRLKAGACRFGGEPAVLVTLRPLDGRACDDPWGADLEDFFVSEETPFALQQGI